MYYEEYGVGRPLVLLHGFGGCVQNWCPFSAKLSERHRAIVVDLRGHGHSTNPENKFTHREAPVTCSSCLKSWGLVTSRRWASVLAGCRYFTWQRANPSASTQWY